MTTTTKLSQHEEREVTLAYLAGVNTGYISEKWGVSCSTIQSNIVGKRSHEWQDPLVEFYRRTNPRDRIRNAVHLYLTYNGQGEGLSNSELIDEWLDKRVYASVDENVFAPRTKKLIEETNLERILEIDKPLSHEQKLLFAIFGRESAYVRAVGLIAPMINARLREAYTQGGRINLNNVYAKISDDIYSMLADGVALFQNPEIKDYAPILRDGRLQRIQVELDRVLRTLTTREEKVLRLRFGIGHYEPHTLKQVGNIIGTKKEQPRQIEAKALRRLRHPSRSKELREFLRS